MATYAVFFTSNNARIVHDQDVIAQISTLPNVLMDPDFSEVHGIPPHLWKNENGKILPMTHDEAKIRLKDIERFGVENKLCDLEHQFLRIKFYEKQRRIKIASAVGLVSISAIGAYLKYKGFI